MKKFKVGNRIVINESVKDDVLVSRTSGFIETSVDEYYTISWGGTENLVAMYGIEREEQDLFALHTIVKYPWRYPSSSIDATYKRCLKEMRNEKLKEILDVLS